MKFKQTAIAIGIATLLGGCSVSKVPAGYQGVKVDLYGSSKGVQAQSVGVGRYWLTFNQELYIFPTFLQNYTWTQSPHEGQSGDESITVQTSEGLTISTDVGITYMIQPDNVSKVFQKYRLGIEEITNTFLRNMVRDAMNEVASTMTVEEIYGARKEEFIAKVQKKVQIGAELDGIQIDKVYLIGSFRLPETVISAINSKIQATQDAIRVQNEVATTRAEAQKKIVQAQAEAQQITIEAEAKSAANKKIAASITPELVSYMQIQKWDGKLPQMQGGTLSPFVTLGGTNGK